MKFILDANIPYSAKNIFLEPDEAIHVRDIGLAHVADGEILQRAFKEGAILVSRDLELGNIIVHPPASHAGVIILRIPPYFTAPNINHVLEAFFASIDMQLLKKAITIVEPGQYRIRKSI